MDIENIKARLRNFVRNHPEYSKNGFLQGISETGKIVIIVNGQRKHITIDELESGHLNKQEENVISFPSVEEKVETLDETPNITPKNEEIEIMEDVPSNVIQMPTANNKEIKTLKDLKDAVDKKDEVSIDKALATFATDSNNGTISINKAIKIVTDNSVNNIVNSVRDNTILYDDMSKYNYKGELIVEPAKSEATPDIPYLTDKGFNNILVYVDIAKFKNVVYTEKQIELAKKKLSTMVEDKLNVLGLNKPINSEIVPDNKKEDNVISFDSTMKKVKELKPDNSIKKAGFADILILTIIVLIYAAIIINLISKLK